MCEYKLSDIWRILHKKHNDDKVEDQIIIKKTLNKLKFKVLNLIFVYRYVSFLNWVEEHSNNKKTKIVYNSIQIKIKFNEDEDKINEKIKENQYDNVGI